MIVCDVCEKLITTANEYDEKVICPNCKFDNSYQLEESDMITDVMDFIEVFYDLDDPSLLDVLTERYGLSHEDALNFLYDYDESDDPSVRISKRKYNT